MNQMQYKGYTAIVEYDAEDECFVGHVAGITDRIAFDGESVPELRRNFHNVLDTYLAHCLETGKTPETPKSRKLLLRLPTELHAYVAQQARTTGESVNNVIIDAVQSFRDRERETATRTVARKNRRARNAANTKSPRK